MAGKSTNRKGAAIEDNFNEEKKNAMGARELKKRLARIAKEVAKKQEILEEGGKNSGKKSKKTEREVQKETVDLEVDAASAYKMLMDMRAVYKDVGGKKKLLNLIKDDDKLLMVMVKELMKIEASLMSTEIRSKETTNNQNATFVILKGLYDDGAAVVQKVEGVDIAQIQDVLNPLSEPKETYEVTIARPEDQK